MAQKKTCFVIGPIGNPESPERKWADKVFKHIITPAVEECGYAKPVRADKIPRPSAITTETLQHILNDDLVIADLSGPNANAYYELAVRHARRKPFIHLIRKGEDSPFDTKDLRTIRIDTEVDTAEEAREEIKKYIPEVEKAADKILTPISQIIEWELMKASGDEQQKTVAEILPRINSIDAHLIEIGSLQSGILDEIRNTIVPRTFAEIIRQADESKKKSQSVLNSIIAEGTIKTI